MSLLGNLLKSGASCCQSAGSLLRAARSFSTGTCCFIRMHAIPPLRTVDRWTEKRSMYGVYDNIGILGKDFKAHPKDVIIAPCWLKGFKGNELQRLIQKKKMKRIRFLYRRFKTAPASTANSDQACFKMHF
uniref:Large ribosomal subunit protein mL51 n=1 Tax=Takifugu rubripes TaxID=31033 RepID=A0A674MIL0_TAKRU